MTCVVGRVVCLGYIKVNIIIIIIKMNTEHEHAVKVYGQSASQMTVFTATS